MHVFPNGKRYIGITKQKPEHRWGPGGNGYKGQTHVWRAIQKYGWDNIEHVVVYTGMTKEEACQAEKDLIRECRSSDPRHGYNDTHGGDHYEVPEHVRKKMRKPKKLTEEAREELRKRGSVQYEKYLKGRKNTPEQNRKIAERKRGVKQDPEVVRRRAESLSKRWKEQGFSEEHRRKMSEALKGRTYRPETLQRMKKAHSPENNARSRKVGQYKDGVLIKIYPSTREAMRQTGIQYTSIVKACYGVRLKHAGGYEWHYI